jgi:outer membrane protein
MRRLGIGAATASLMMIGGTAAAHAQVGGDGGWYLHAGPAQLALADEAKVRLNGTEIPGAGYSSDPQTTTVIEIGRQMTYHWAFSATLGAPPKAEAKGSGTIAAIGELGTATYGPMAATAHYHFNPDGAFQPYAGIGVSYMHVFDTSDGAMTGLEIDNTWGPVWQVGAEYRVNEKWAAFIDVKQAYLETEARGTISGMPASADMVFDPFVVNAGIGWRF